MPGQTHPLTGAVEQPPDVAAAVTEERSLRQQALRDPGVRALIRSRLLSMLGLTTLTYGSMVYLATIGAPQIVVSLMGGTSYLAAFLFGIGGGALADATSKRTAMVSAYALQAAACFVIPTVWGTSAQSLIVLIFVIAALGQIVTPAVKAATALVTTAAQVAIVAALISVAGGIGSALGTTVLAPFLISVTTLQFVAYASGIILALGAVRAMKVPPEESAASLTKAARGLDWRGSLPTLRHTAAWLLANRKVAAMILVGSMVVALFDGMNSLMPVYVRDVLHSDPKNAVYILAPGGVGFMAGTALGPWLMGRRGEKALGVMAFMLFGAIDLVAPVLGRVSPLRLLELFGREISPEIAAAGLISILTAFGSTTAGAAVQTYVNRYVILARQATTFGMQEVLDNAITLTAIISFGAIATWLGPRVVFVLAPPLIVTVVVVLVRGCFRISAQDPPEVRALLRAVLDTSPPEAAPS